MIHRYTGPHADTLGNGRPIAPGENVENIDVEHPVNAHMLTTGLLVDVTPEQTPTPQRDRKATTPEEES
jgi:hypothetical protein